MMQPMQATLLTFGGRPITMVGALDMVSGVLSIIGPTPKPLRTRHKSSSGPAAFVTDDWRADDFDGLFSHEQMADAVVEMRSMQAQECLMLATAAQRWDTNSVVAFDGMGDDGKPKIRMSQTAENAHVAILAMCWLSRSLMVAQHVADAGDLLVEQSWRSQDVVFRAPGQAGLMRQTAAPSGNPHNIVAGTGMFEGMQFFGCQPPGGEL